MIEYALSVAGTSDCCSPATSFATGASSALHRKYEAAESFRKPRIAARLKLIRHDDFKVASEHGSVDDTK